MAEESIEQRIKLSIQNNGAKGDHQREVAKALGDRLGGALPVYLTENGQSWYIHVKKYKPTPETETFAAQWDLHPESFHALNLFGKIVHESRYSQSWGVSYSYSGSVSPARDYERNAEGEMVQSLVNEVNELVSGIFPCSAPYNGCLQNWYLPEHKIGLHSDDETAMKKGYPVFSLSWGGPRRFLFRARGNRRDMQELLLEDGDLLVMGGTCQQTHKHEVPKVRVTMDPAAKERINWTIRAFVQKGK